MTVIACPKFAYAFLPLEGSLIKPVVDLSCFPLVVGNVVIVKPGASGKLFLRIKPIDIDSDVILAFKVSDPLGNQALPEGLISLPSKAVAENGSQTLIPITVNAALNAAQKTYLIELDVYWRMPDWSHSMQTKTLFLLSIWDGKREWPHPPKQLLAGLT